MTLPPLLRPSYWFSSAPAPFMPIVERGLLVLFAALAVTGVIARLAALKRSLDKMTKRAIIRAANVLMTLGFVGLLLYWFDYERVPVLSARAWYILWLALAVWLVWRLVNFIRIEMPAAEQRKQDREQIEKWLPKARK